MTLSCPVGILHPIGSSEEIVQWLEAAYGQSFYVVSRERHADGKAHYHGYFKFDGEID